ncbi:His Kinase A (phospho-acceptor) domain protein [Maioricimonas rarisocia]|uniref:histidine kinase n=1 Tax=Maioricimonas rarisocia TaxID=2528026 RepID=A0A517Z7Y3_9PLAN|nr:histidine kinase dimerization/phospho-acceptor domain-containing protein [Maioricimonas rarisocia]QDU38602.1 His Kinase A (phospho-acceptor) domain protein [Maioricimonas rarisocia]
MSQSVTRLSLQGSDPVPPDESVAHRIRHSLFTIRTAVELVRDRYVRPGEGEHLFEIIEREQQQLSRIVEQLVRRQRRSM